MATKITTTVNIMVWSMSSAQPPQRDLTMPYVHGVDNWSLGFSRKVLLLDHGERGS